MINQWGSHRRLRVAMFCIALALVCYGAWQGWRWKSRVIVPWGGWPAIYRVVHPSGRESIEAFDWKGGRRWTIARNELCSSVRVSGNGQTVLWRSGAQICLANVLPSHRRRTATTPFDQAEYDFVGASADARYVVFQSWAQRVFMAGGSTVALTRRGTGRGDFRILQVIDLTTGKAVSKREWNSAMQESTQPGEFESLLDGWGNVASESEPARGRWKLTAAGGWELIERLPITNSMAATMRRRDPVKERELARWSSVVIPGETAKYSTDEGRVLIYSDVRDDITAIDAANGKVIARQASGSRRRLQLFAVGIALLVCAFIWARIAVAEVQTWWGVCDALVATLLIHAALFPFLSSVESLFPQARGADFEQILSRFAPRGALVGIAILVGWYWAYGRAWFGLRWLTGTVLLAATAIPVIVREVHFEGETSLRVWVVVGLLVAALTMMLAVWIRLLGWGIRDASDAPKPFSFGLLGLLILVSGAGMTVVLIQGLFATANVHVFDGAFSAAFIGIPLAGILFLRSNGHLVLAMMVLLVTTFIAGSSYVDAMGRIAPADRLSHYFGEGVSAVSAGVTILLPCMVLRSRGWGWTRLREADASKEAMA